MKRFALSVALCAFPLSASAEDFGPTSYTLATLDNFYGFCLNAHFRSELALQMAQDLEWERLPQYLLDVHRPLAEFAFFEGWLVVPSAELPPFFGFAGKPLAEPGDELCAAFFRRVNPSEFLEFFVEETDAELAFQEDGIDMARRVFFVPSLPSAVVTIDTPTRAGRSDVFVSVLSIRDE